mmetsp:Transcript_3392/g.9748  ORF Transcript_3392/g.9748 Transcript_3392/m.9748 type:complete len:80 (-) Transcript_3392:284-523(-)
MSALPRAQQQPAAWAEVLQSLVSVPLAFWISFIGPRPPDWDRCLVAEGAVGRERDAGRRPTTTTTYSWSLLDPELLERL